MAINERTDLTPKAKEIAIHNITQSMAAEQVAEAAQEKAKKDANESASGEYTTAILQGHLDGMIDKIAIDPRLTPETKFHLAAAVEKYAKNGIFDKQKFGDGFSGAYKDVVSEPDAPGHISDVNQLYRRAAEGGDLTLDGAHKLADVMRVIRKSPDAAGLHTTKSAMLAYAKQQLTFDEEASPNPLIPPKRDPKGLLIYNSKFIPKFEAAYDKWVQSGKDPYEFLTKENVDKLSDGMRSRKDRAKDELEALGGIGEKTLAIPPAPEGFDEGKWQLEVGQTAHGYSPQLWGKIIEKLASQPTKEAMDYFDKTFGPRGARKAAEILKSFGKEAKGD